MKALQTLGLSQREACASVHARRRSARDQASTKALDDARVAVRLTEVAQAHAEHGCRRLFEDYERDAELGADEYMTYKRFRRLYRLASLQIGRRRRRGRAKIVRGRSLRRATKVMQLWSEQHDVELLFIQPGKPTQNAFIESFNSRVRSELFNAHWFRTLTEAQGSGYAWLHGYNTTHAHSALGYRTPEEFLATYETNNLPQKSVAA